MLDSTIRLSVPLLLACLAGLYSERSGIFDIGLEGKMLVAAFAAGAAAAVTGSAWLGLAAAIVASIALRAGPRLRLDHAARQPDRLRRRDQLPRRRASTAVLGKAWFGQGGRTPQLADAARFTPIDAAVRRRGPGRAGPRPDLRDA